MRIFLLADGSSIHTKRWVKGLHHRGYKLFLFSLNKIDSELDFLENKYSADLDFSENKISTLSKLEYLKVFSKLKGLLKEFKPDLIHAHYASSYGLLCALCGFKPFVLSVWGSDVFDFPRRSFIHKSILSYNLKKADKILSTSYAMATETKKYTDNIIEITPFGIDVNFFKKQKKIRLKEINSDDLVIGTIKSLERVYGLNFLIEAFNILLKRGYKNLKLLIVGKGSQLKVLEQMTIDYGIADQVIFVGWLPYSKVPSYHNLLDIAVYPSISESFGVSVIESGACEVPAVVSNRGGLVEVVENDKTGLIATAENAQSFADNMEVLILDKNKREEMGKEARKRVEKYYNWEENLSLMEEIYKSIA